VITAFGDESNLAIVESDLNDPAAGGVQLSVEYTIVSGSDVNMRRGTYPLQKKPPLTPGYSVIGRVRLNGPGSGKFGIGDCVACLSKYEGQSELINLPEQFLVGVPEALGPVPWLRGTYRDRDFQGRTALSKKLSVIRGLRS
jgi:synaptic vesicle membrane protein VAT-1